MAEDMYVANQHYSVQQRQAMRERHNREYRERNLTWHERQVLKENREKVRREREARLAKKAKEAAREKVEQDKILAAEQRQEEI